MDKSKSHLDKKGNTSEGSQRNPQSPGKRRMVESTTTPMVRLISRGGCTTESDEEVEVIRAQVSQPSYVTSSRITARTQQPILDTTASRKRKTLNPMTTTTPVVILPSPTTQIARRIDSINLETLHNSAPVPSQGSGQQVIHEKTKRLTPPLSSSSVPLVQQNVIEERMDQGPASVVVESPFNAKKNVIIDSITSGKEDEVIMERYLQRPEEASNMKRLISSQDKGEEENKRKSKGSSKMPKTTSGYQSEILPSLNNHVMTSVRVPTIHQSSSSRQIQYPLPTSTITTTVTNPIMTTSPMIATGQPLTPFPLPLLPFSSLPLLPSIVPPTSTSPQHQSKTKSFSINDLLSKEPTQPPQPQQQSYSYINPSLLLLYQQWITQQLAAAAALNQTAASQRFHGESAETDSKHSSPTTTVSVSSQDVPVGGFSSKSPIKSNSSSGNRLNSSPLPPRSSPTVTVTDDSPVEVSSVTSPSREEEEQQEKGGVGSEGRQNALLQVSEAHLAILPDEDGDTPLHLAIIQENIPLTFYLVRLITGVSMKLDIANNLRQTPLHLAVITGQSMLVNLLVQAGASIDHPDRRGNTCVHLAAQRKNVSILQILSQAENHSPDYNARNFAGLTPVHIATREGSVEVLKFLFQMGANRNMADSCSGRTALHYAVEAQNFQVCNFLLENNVNVNAVTFSGNTPLHVAAGRRLKEIVALLMAYGANPAIANGEGDFPSDLPASLLMQRAKMGNR